jgi:hypothetical protein
MVAVTSVKLWEARKSAANAIVTPNDAWIIAVPSPSPKLRGLGGLQHLLHTSNSKLKLAALTTIEGIIFTTSLSSALYIH